jgi:hypothetical protein
MSHNTSFAFDEILSYGIILGSFKASGEQRSGSNLDIQRKATGLLSSALLVVQEGELAGRRQNIQERIVPASTEKIN